MKQHGIFLIIVFYVLLLPAVGLTLEEKDHDHDHGGEAGQLYEKDAHDRHDLHSDHADTNVEHEEKNDHDVHDDEEVTVVLTDKAMEFARLTIEVVNKKSIGRSIELPGEIGFNEDRLAHITPRYPGIVKQVVKQLGETVQKGELLAVVESNESLAAYTISSPISGKIVKKHITSGEFVGEDATLFVVADLTTVWVNCDVYARDADFVKSGQEIQISAVGTDWQVKARLSYVASVYNKTTRSMIARAVIPNTGEKWRPGTFITGTIPVSTDKHVLVVSRSALQLLYGETIVFVPGEHKNEFNPVVVQKGVENNRHVEILSGLEEGDIYVATGAFELKAKIVTSALGGHAGHGH